MDRPSLIDKPVSFFRPGYKEMFSGTVEEDKDDVLIVNCGPSTPRQLIHPSWILGGQVGSVTQELIKMAGDDPNRQGLLETPKRFEAAWAFWMSGYKEDPKAVLKVFEDGSEKYDQMVFQRGIPVWSHCEHHLAPFFGEAHIAYIPNGKVVGLSKLVRVTDIFARRLQIQERLTSQIADCLFDELSAEGVGVVIECRHTCMESRGVRVAGTITRTAALRGSIKDEDSARAEFYSHVNCRR